MVMRLSILFFIKMQCKNFLSVDKPVKLFSN